MVRAEFSVVSKGANFLSSVAMPRSSAQNNICFRVNGLVIRVDIEEEWYKWAPCGNPLKHFK